MFLAGLAAAVTVSHFDAAHQANRIADTARDSCITQRIDSNHRAMLATQSVDVLRSALSFTRQARLASYHHTHAPYDLQAARDASELLRELEGIQFEPSPLNDCKDIQ